MKRDPKILRPIDARFATWLTASSPATVGYHMSCGLTLPEVEQTVHGQGPGWQGRARTAVLRECYKRQLDGQSLEEVEVATIYVLPAPDEDGDRPRPPFVPNAEERWEEAIRAVSADVRNMLQHGPASGAAGGKRLCAGGTLKAEVAGLEVEQYVDLIWRRPDGKLEVVLVFEESLEDTPPSPAAEDWRCVLAAVVVRGHYGQSPDVHSVWATEASARVEPITDETLEKKLADLGRILEKAQAFDGFTDKDEGAFYHLTDKAGFQPESSRGPGGRRSGYTRSRRRR